MLGRFNFENQIYFITTKTFQGRDIFNHNSNCRIFIDTLKDYRKLFKLYGFVIIPNHVHLLIEPINIDISKLMNYIKGKSSRLINIARVAEPLGSAATERERSTTRPSRKRIHAEILRPGIPVWQKSFHDHVIRKEEDFLEKINYIHKNPLKHGVAENLDEYIWSSYRNYYLNSNSLIEINKIEI